MAPSHILFNAAPYRLTDADRQKLLAACAPAQITEADGTATSPDQLPGGSVNVLVTEEVPRNLVAWPNLRFIQLLSAGANHLMDHPIRQTDLPVCTASGTHSVPIAQYVTGTLLMMTHRMPKLLEFQSSRAWPDRVALAGTLLRGLTVGIIGYGSIGRECARQLSALGMRIICLKRNPASRSDTGYSAWPETGDPEGKIPQAWFGPDQLQAMLPLCDLVVVTAPITPQTQGMIGKAELALLKKSARLIIISRGGIVAEQALAAALRAGQLAEAVVDCFVDEPIPPKHFFFDTPNLIMTPHMSGVYTEFWPAMIGLVSENLRRFKNCETYGARCGRNGESYVGGSVVMVRVTMAASRRA